MNVSEGHSLQEDDMPRLLKCFIRGSLVELCFSTEEGLPFVATPPMVYLLQGIIGVASTLYSVKICNLTVMANHIHMLVVVTDPEAVPDFVEYTKRESAHLVNRLLDRPRHTVWIDGYDSPAILDAEKALNRMAYCYLNPVRADLVSSVDDYPQLSSWSNVLHGSSAMTVYKIPRNRIVTFYATAMAVSLEAAIEEERRQRYHRAVTLRLEPFGWKSCFYSTAERSDEVLREQVVAKVRAEEEELAAVRKGDVLGPERLKRQPINIPYTPARLGKRMMCLSTFKELRKIFIQWTKELYKAAREATVTLSFGAQALLPPGFFYPGGYLLSNLYPLASPLPLD